MRALIAVAILRIPRVVALREQSRIQIRRLLARAREARGDERQRLYDEHARRYPEFAAYPNMISRGRRWCRRRIGTDA
jgi:hypothetical protein